jgi:hypothetical protein
VVIQGGTCNKKTKINPPLIDQSSLAPIGDDIASVPRLIV